ncbi:chaperone modulator CbpM [Odoribacter laneus]|jgi:hypothetical protein|nr:chaperone modulator CbpM [Odoribacter laneus]
METDLIIVSDYCRESHIEQSFVVLLWQEGLIDIKQEEGREYLFVSQLRDLERYSRMYYDLSINIEGIDAIRHLLSRIEDMQHELHRLRGRLRRFEVGEEYPEYYE